MGGFSPAAYLLWSILACLFQVFLVVHLYYYDKFQCVKWSSGRQPGAFKRVMTYSYLATVPLLMVFSLTMAVLSYKEGYIDTDARGDITPRPFVDWSNSSTKWLLPIYFVLASAWAFELVTHLEELTFWLFVLHQGPTKRDWFQSWEFRVWYIGSMTAILGMLIVVLVRRNNVETCFAWIFLSGSSAGSATTLCFVYVLARFPAFIRHVKFEGAEPDVVVRLATFYQLNIIRIIFRFLFNFSLLTLALDGLRGSHIIVRNPATSDLLCMLGGIGCFVSSSITFLIFFPRSITRESGYRAKLSSTQSVDKPPDMTSPLPDYHHERHVSSPLSPKSTIRHSRSQMYGSRMNGFHFPGQHSIPYGQHRRSFSQGSEHRSYEGEATPEYDSDPENIPVPPPAVRKYQPGTKRSSGAEEDNMALEMRSEDCSPPFPRQRDYLQQQGRKRNRSVEPPYWDDGDADSFDDHDRRRQKRVNTGIVVIPHVAHGIRPPTMGIEEAPALTPHNGSFVHPYVMTFTSPIDLLDVEDDDIPPRGVV